MTDAKFLHAMLQAGVGAPATETDGTIVLHPRDVEPPEARTAAGPRNVVRRYVDRKTGAPASFVRSVYLGRNDPCPCGCKKKAKRCERGVELLEKARWA